MVDKFQYRGENVCVGYVGFSSLFLERCIQYNARNVKGGGALLAKRIATIHR